VSPRAVLLVLLCACAWSPARAEAPRTLKESLRAGRFDGNIRLYYMNRDYDPSRIQEAFALGGAASYLSPSWRGLSAGLTGFTSQRGGIAPGGRDGTYILAPGQKSYAVLGEAYARAEGFKTELKLFRQKLDTPFLNPWDIKMTPVTVEAYTLTNSALPFTQAMLSYVHRIKPWSSVEFRPMSDAAGFEGTDHPVVMAGAVVKPAPNAKFQLWDYVACEFMNLLYAQADYAMGAGEDVSFELSGQTLWQRDIGRQIGGDFHTGASGIKGTLTLDQRAAFKLSFTNAEEGHDVVNPWGGYPGYTSIMEEDCDVAGEKAWGAGFSYDFKGTRLEGLSFFMDHTSAHVPGGTPLKPPQRETDLTVDYRFKERLSGLWLRMRAASVHDSLSVVSRIYRDYRIILNYDF